ncbi:MAG: hypothetical protein IT424_14295 [Pirellulales bacterium]|nr:hypothetical protein [Pirellulales bacterium]
MLRLTSPSRVGALAIAVYGLIVATPTVAHAAVALDANFDSGSLQSYSVVRDTINLVGRDSYAGSGYNLGDDHWRWLYFKASGVQGRNLTFSIRGEFAGDGSCCDDPSIETDHELYDHEMVYSYDGVNWNFFPNANNTLSTADPNPANDLFTFTLNAPFAADEVYVAYAIPYPYSRSVDHSQAVLATPWAAPTASGNAAGVIGQAPAGVDELGRNHPARDLFAYRITNPATDSAAPKRKAMVVTGQHAAETLGVYTFEGLVNWLVSDDPRAAALRDKAEIFCYPTLNASGRAAGLTRAMLQWPNSDSNGYWDEGPAGNDWNSPERTEQKLNGEAMLADQAATPGDGLDLFVDFHSSVPDYGITGPNGLGPDSEYPGEFNIDDWGYVRTSANHHLNPWWVAYRQLQPNLLQESGSSTSARTTTAFAQNEMSADIAVTLETQFAISRPISYYHDLGMNAGLAMYEAWVRIDNPLEGDFDEDGDVDAGDLTAWQQGFGLASGALHFQGDANGDGAVDAADYLVWQQQFAPALAQVANAAGPEPHAALLAVVAMALLAPRLRAAGSTYIY